MYQFHTNFPKYTCTLYKYTYERFVHMKTYHKVSFIQILSTRLFPNQFQLQYETSEDEWDDLSFPLLHLYVLVGTSISYSTVLRNSL